MDRIVPLSHMLTAKLTALRNDMAAVKPTDCNAATGDVIQLMMIDPAKFQQWIQTIGTLVGATESERGTAPPPEPTEPATEPATAPAAEPPPAA